MEFLNLLHLQITEIKISNQSFKVSTLKGGLLTMLSARQCWPAVSPRVLVQSGRGFCAGSPHGLQLSFRCQVIPLCYRYRVVLTVLSFPAHPSR